MTTNLITLIICFLSAMNVRQRKCRIPENMKNSENPTTFPNPNHVGRIRMLKARRRSDRQRRQLPRQRRRWRQRQQQQIERGIRRLRQVRREPAGWRQNTTAGKTSTTATTTTTITSTTATTLFSEVKLEFIKNCKRSVKNRTYIENLMKTNNEMSNKCIRGNKNKKKPDKSY